jgi:hypothetical protein
MDAAAVRPSASSQQNLNTVLNAAVVQPTENRKLNLYNSSFAYSPN